MSDIEIEIDGKILQAKPDAMVIQVADEAGIYIPRFCYHKHLSIAANCRMCLVEVEKSGKPLPACATPVTAGMKVFTRSPKALAAQKAVMEFLLINHPLDCPICDQGGECELQDLSMGFGSSKSFYTEGKRSVKDKDIGPLIETEMTRCIQCTRCVRFGTEVAGMRELGVTNRGEDMEIGTYIEHAMRSEVSGNVIDICPVGALTSKPYRFTARPWELEQRATISPHDCVGSNLYAHTRNGVVMRMVPRENVNINETWISDRDRYSYEGLYHKDRVQNPLVKKNGIWEETDWQSALELAAAGLQRVVVENGPEQLGALASPNSTLEEFYLLQKLMRGLGSNNIDHRLREVDFSDQSQVTFPFLKMPIAELEQCDTVLLIGSDIRKEQPSAALRLRKAFLKGAKLMALNLVDYDFNFDLVAKQIVAADEMVSVLAGLAHTLVGTTKTTLATDLKNLLAQQTVNETHLEMAKRFQEGKKACILIGNIAMHLPQAATIRALASLIAKMVGANFGVLTEGGNSAGAWMAGAVPHHGKSAEGLNAQTMLQAARKGYLLLNVEPNLDCANPLAANQALAQADFVVALSLFRNETLDAQADIILPMAPFTETAGTFINASGEWQKFSGVATSFAQSRPAWKILRVLGNLLHLQGFDYESADDVYHEVKTVVANTPVRTELDIKVTAEQLKPNAGKSLQRVGSIPLYATDSLVRRSGPLQAAQPILEGVLAHVRLHPKTAAHFELREGDLVTVKQKQGSAKLPVAFDARLSERSVYLPGGIVETSNLSELFGAVELEK